MSRPWLGSSPTGEDSLVRKAVTSAARFMSDQDGLAAINRAVAALANDPDPADAFIRGSYRRLRVGEYRVLYSVEGDLISVIWVDRVN